MHAGVPVQLNSKQCQVVYETGETEELQVDELIRDGIMSLGWVPAPGPGRPDSAGELSVAGTQPLPVHVSCHGVQDLGPR